MNRIRGSVCAKIVAWLVLILSTLFFVGSCVAVVFMEDYGVFRQKKEETLENELSDVSYSYSSRALANYRDGIPEENEKYFDDKAFRYGIIEAESLDGIDLNDEDSYLMRNFKDEVSKDELQEISFYLTEHSEIWYSVNIFGEYGYFTETIEEQSLYADRICYDTAEGIFYYRAEGKYYPVQNVSIRMKTQVDDTRFQTDYYSFVFDNDKNKYINMNASNASATGNDSMATEMALLQGEEEITFNMFDGTALDYSNWNLLLFDDIREIEASELTLIDSQTIPKSSFVEVEYAYLDEYYTLHVSEKSNGKHYTVVSYIDKAALEAEKKAFLSKIGSNSWDSKLEAVIMADASDSYVRVEVLIDALYEMKENIIVFMFGTFLLAVTCFVFLVCAAGHRRKKEEIVPTFLEKIPLDVLCAAVFFIEGLAASIWIVVCYLDSISLVIQLCIVIGILMACLAMITLLSFAVRVKMGKWWRNSITYWIFAKVRNVCVRLWKNIGILWKLIAVIFAYMIASIFIGFCMGADEEICIFVILEAVIIFPALTVLVLQFRKLQEGSRMIAEGNLHHKIDTTKMFWEFKKHADNLNRISEGMSHAVDERMKSERFKTELITNVSHDIKTPLTSIINYVDLLEKTDIQDETAKEYLEVLDRQSARLKKLIEDLIEASKASTGNLSVSMEELEANVFVTQILGEFEEKVANAGLELIINKPEEEIPVRADGRHLWRVVDNLMNNICKYAQPETRVYINLEQTQDKILLTFRNMSKYPLNITSEELMERFVRGDSSRNTEGNGLGLSIAKSLMELMNGKLLLFIDGDLFKVVLEFPR